MNGIENMITGSTIIWIKKRVKSDSLLQTHI